MEELSFGEQVKIILSRKNMTIKELSEQIRKRTGKAMSRQNLTQRLGRDNFQEKDMRMIAAILDCPFRLSIFPEDSAEEAKILKDTDTGRSKYRRKPKQEEEEGYQQTLVFEEETKEAPKEALIEDERDMTIGELYELHEELKELEVGSAEEPAEEQAEEISEGTDEKENIQHDKETDKGQEKTRKPAREVITPDSEDFEPVIKYDDVEEDLSVGEMNPYTCREYQTNSVRMHPTRIGYVQVYDRKIHQWTDMTEWAFLGYQERKKALLGKDYEPPIYLD